VAALPVAAVLAAGCGDTPPPTKVSTFRTPEPTRWVVTSHPLGRGTFQTANVAFGRGGLALSLPQGTLNGGELQAKGFEASGTSSARMRSATSPGSISAFFLYRHDFKTDSSDELDFEIPGGQPNRVLLTVWRRGIKTPVAQKTVPLPFDPAAGMHDYAFVRKDASVKFLIDGREVFSSAKAPSNALKPIFNAWYPTWQDPTVPPAGGRMAVQRYAFTPAG
jgi:beta-glucanase (GH16 family)